MVTVDEIKKHNGTSEHWAMIEEAIHTDCDRIIDCFRAVQAVVAEFHNMRQYVGADEYLFKFLHLVSILRDDAARIDSHTASVMSYISDIIEQGKENKKDVDPIKEKIHAVS